jgi:hypothetical protein
MEDRTGFEEIKALLATMDEIVALWRQGNKPDNETIIELLYSQSKIPALMAEQTNRAVYTVTPDE